MFVQYRMVLLSLALSGAMAVGCGTNSPSSNQAAAPVPQPIGVPPPNSGAVAPLIQPAQPPIPPAFSSDQNSRRLSKELEPYGVTIYGASDNAQGSYMSVDVKPTATAAPDLPEIFRRLDAAKSPFNLFLNSIPGPAADSVREALKLENLRGLQISGTSALPALEIGSNRLEVLRLTGLLPSTDLSFLGKFPNLTSLSAGGDSLTGSDLKPLTKLTKLRSLDLRGKQLTDADLGFIVNMTKLRNLSLRSPQITIGLFRHSADLPDLTEIMIYLGKPDANLAQDTPQKLSKGLLELRRIDLSNDGLATLKGLPTIRKALLVDVRGVKAAGAKVIASWPNLEDVHLSGVYLQPAEFAELSAAKNLKGITLMEGGDDYLAAMGRIPGLEKVSMFGAVSDTGLAHLKKCTQLKELSLVGGGSLSDAGIGNVAGMTGLTRLQISEPINKWEKITDAGIDPITKLSNLEYLGLDGASITDSGIAKLIGLSKLQTISLMYTKVTGKVFDELIKFPKLNVVWLAGTPAASANPVRTLPSSVRVYK